MTEITSEHELKIWIDRIGSLDPDSADHPHYVEMVDFMKLSPEKIFRKIGINQIKISRKIKDTKRQVHSKLRQIDIKDRLNLDIPTNTTIKYWPRLTSATQQGESVSINLTNCICLDKCKLEESSGKGKSSSFTFFKGAIYNYGILNSDDYILVHRHYHGIRDYKMEISSDDFHIYFMDLREWKINSILNLPRK
jgi:hypothetical protein